MKHHAFDFEALGDTLRTDIQAYLNTYAAEHPGDGPVQAFCLYFDSGSGTANGMVLSLAATRTAGVTLADVASWFYYADHVEAPHSEVKGELEEAYTEVLYAADDATSGELVEQFQAMIRQLLLLLSFERLPRTDDFIYFALGMDEDFASWADTIPPALLKKHFGQ